MALAEEVEEEEDHDHGDDGDDDPDDMADMPDNNDESVDTAKRAIPLLLLLLKTTAESGGSIDDCLPAVVEEKRVETEDDDEVRLRFLSFADNDKPKTTPYVALGWQQTMPQSRLSFSFSPCCFLLQLLTVTLQKVDTCAPQQ